MTNKEALKVINENLSVAIHDWDDSTDEYQREQAESFQKAKEALEKQIPKKPVPSVLYDAKFWCGQRLNWSEEK